LRGNRVKYNENKEKYLVELHFNANLIYYILNIRIYIYDQNNELKKKVIFNQIKMEKYISLENMLAK
jgi:hypothetical protein